MRLRSKTLLVMAALPVTFLSLSFGTALCEGWSVGTGFYYGTTALTTVGFGDVVPVTSLGRLLTAILVPVGILLAFGIGMMLVQDSFRALVTRRSFQMVPSGLSDHCIVCGFGNIGQVVVRALLAAGRKVCVIDANVAKLSLLEKEDIPYVIGDAMSSAALTGAGLARAKTLITTFDDDAHNVYVVLEARDLNRNVEIIATASGAEAGRKMLLAGAKRMISPQAIAGEMLAGLSMNADVLEMFTEAASASSGPSALRQVVVTAESWLAGLELKDLGRQAPGVRVALAKVGDHMHIAPGGSFRLHVGTVLLVVGDADALGQLTIRRGR